MKIGSLFTGTGGLDMAVEAVTGATTAWVSDIDPGACKIIAHRYPDVPNHGDITGIDWQAVEPVDILTGGFPCQDLSHAGKRAGLRPDTRSGLWTHMAYAIDQLRPRMVVAENVRGLLSAEALGPVEPCPWCVGDGSEFDLRALGRVLADLADLGYDAQWCGLRAADVGAPHGRFRVFLLAYPQGDGRHEGRPESARLIGRSDAAERGGGATADARGEVGIERAGLCADESTGDRRGQSARGGRASLLPTPTTRDHKGRNQRDDDTCLTGALMVKLLPTPEAKLGINGGSQHPDRVRAGGHTVSLKDVTEHLDFGQYADAIARWETLTRPAPAPTDPTGRNGAHRLSPRFVEWMMGLPAGHVTDVPGLSRNAQLKALGNGVVPQQAVAALTHMLTAGRVAA